MILEPLGDRYLPFAYGVTFSAAAYSALWVAAVLTVYYRLYLFSRRAQIPAFVQGRPSRRERVKLLYFAWVRQKIGKNEETLNPPSTVANVADLAAYLRGQGPGYADAFADPSLLRAARNQEHVGFDALVGPDDEIAFFPPVTGGERDDNSHSRSKRILRCRGGTGRVIARRRRRGRQFHRICADKGVSTRCCWNIIPA